MTTTHIDINSEFQTALNLLNDTNKSVFLTGNAGTGKSTLLRHFIENTEKNVAVLAPTGIAALNVGGQTIHSFFRFPIGADPKKSRFIKYKDSVVSLVQNLDTLVIDEISMVRSDLLDCVDQAMRGILKVDEPFGGKQVVFIGDLCQLPPVVQRSERKLFEEDYLSPYFFDAKCFSGFLFEKIHLKKIYRQSDDEFIEILNDIRLGSADHGTFMAINQRVLSGEVDLDGYIVLASTNKTADEINESKLRQLESKEHVFHAAVSGKFKESNFPTQCTLFLKEGAQVMMLNNDKFKRWVNGTLGVVREINKRGVFVELEGGQTVNVERYKWEMNEYKWNKKEKKMEKEALGEFIQLPLRLSWAITIHKSQGKTFDKVLIDMGMGAFAHGQTYVALSRCTSLDGLLLKKPLSPSDLIVDSSVRKFIN